MGELAKAAELTVRALRYYDQVGLLRPSGRSAAGHRLYDADDVTRLYQVVALRHLGLNVADTRAALATDSQGLVELVQSLFERLGEEIETRRRLRAHLRQALDAINRMGRPTVPQMLEVIAAMTMLERYLTPEQLETLRAERATRGDAGVRAASERRLQLIAELNEAHASGVAPTDEGVRRLAQALDAWFHDFIPDAEIAQALGRMVQIEGVEQASGGVMSDALGRYVAEALA